MNDKNDCLNYNLLELKAVTEFRHEYKITSLMLMFEIEKLQDDSLSCIFPNGLQQFDYDEFCRHEKKHSYGV